VVLISRVSFKSILFTQNKEIFSFRLILASMAEPPPPPLYDNNNDEQTPNAAAYPLRQRQRQRQ
jgi:hypothetical protein